MTNKKMPLSEALRIMKIERECVLRQDTPECNRDECGCQCCDLVQEPDDVVAAYDAIIKAAEAQAKLLISLINTLAERTNKWHIVMIVF